MIEYVSSAPGIEHIAPAPAVTLSVPSQQLPPAYATTSDTTDDNFDTTDLVHPQFSFPAVEVISPQVVGSLPPLDEFVAPGYNRIHQEQIVAGETTQNTFENPVVQEQVVVQEFSQAPQVADSFSLLKEVAAREYNQVLQPPVIFQEIPEVQVVERIQSSQTALNTSSTSTNSGVPAATHAATAVATTDDDILDDEQDAPWSSSASRPVCAHAQDEEGGD